MSSKVEIDNSFEEIIYKDQLLKIFHKHHLKILYLGFVLRLIASATNLEAYDYIIYRIPISIGLSEGDGLYNDLGYNQMPIYPYLSALMYLIFGDQNKILTAIILRFPITVADSLIPVVLYRIAIKLDKKKKGLIASVIYALNPISLIEISVATFHSIGSLFFLLSLYYLLTEKYNFTGFFIALGFFTSEFPIIALGLSIIILRKEFLNLSKLILTFLFTSLIILILVLVPYEASLNDMYSNLSRHPIYKGTIRGVVSELFSFLNENYGVSEDVYYDIWLVSFLFCILIPIIILLQNQSKELLLDALVFQITLLSLFFTANHTKHIFWLFPWLTLWAIIQDRKITISPILLAIVYSLRRYSQDYLESAVWISTLMLAILGIWILLVAFSNMKNGKTLYNSLKT